MTRHRKPRILYVTPFWPHRAGIGAEVRSRQVLEALRGMGDVEVVVLQDANGRAGSAPDAVTATVMDTVNVMSRPTNGLAAKVRWMFAARLQYPHGCGVESGGAERVLRAANDFDLVWFFKLRSPNLFPNWAWPHSVVDIDDVPSTYERALARDGRRFLERLSGRTACFGWRRRERLLGERFNVLSVCSEGDREYLKSLGVEAPIHVIPNGFDQPVLEPVPKPASPARIGFIGLFDYLPNRDGIRWFAEQCWPLIKRELPDARLRLVGRGSDGSAKPAGPDIDGLGWVEQTEAEIATWSAMIVPIRIGAGTRVKIAQGFGQKCPTVSTKLGAYGYDVVDGREILLADSAKDFADACVRLIRQPKEARQMADRAWQLFLKNWTWDAIRPRVWAAAEDCLRRRADEKSTGNV